MARIHLEDPELCPSCKEPMKVLAALSSPAHDEVIERVLRARGEWDPPWGRERKARAPLAEGTQRPALLPCEEDVSQLRAETDEEFNQDVPRGEMGPEAKLLLTFEVMPDDNEVFVVGNAEGLKSLIQAIQNVLDTKDHDHLFTPRWAGSELSEHQKSRGATS